MNRANTHHAVAVIGGGTAGISVAARLLRQGVHDVAVVDPAVTHYYQPLWTLVGGGCAPMDETGRPEASVMPKQVTWRQQAATSFDPDNQRVTLVDDSTIEYDALVVCPGIQLDWNGIPGMPEAMNTPHVSSNYLPTTAPKTWELIRNLRSGTAVFTMPSKPIKCAGAPQKIAYLAADYWKKQRVLSDIRVVLVLPTPGMFGVKVFSDELERVAARYGIEVRTQSDLTGIDPDTRQAVITDNSNGIDETVHYDLLHVVPPQSAPDWIKSSPLAVPDDPGGYVDVDKETMQHNRYPQIFSLGDAGSTPNSKTGAAIRKQAPVAAHNVQSVLAGSTPTATYDGYASCPLTTSRHTMLLAEFDYSMQPAPTFKFIDTTKERHDMWYLKRYGLPYMYWNLMLKGRA